MTAPGKTALIFGVTGQDGSYLARFLLERGYRVHGTSRSGGTSGLENHRLLGIADRISIQRVKALAFQDVVQVVRDVTPQEVYNLAGLTSVALSFNEPREAYESIALGTLHALEAVRTAAPGARVYNACSSECFGDVGEAAANEATPFHPQSPYAVAKAAAYWQVANHRAAHGLYACSGILFNHESPLRPPHFVTRKVVRGAAAIAAGTMDTLELGNLDIERDWGWAPEYVEAMWRMLQQPEPGDFVIATGESHSLRGFVAAAFAHYGLDWQRHVRSNPALLRPTDIRRSRGDPSRAAERLDWRARARMADVVRMMAEAEAAVTTAIE